jgi:large subunit ribosomal protein L35
MERQLVDMPKMKTHKGMKKRFKVSATGKVRHKRAGSSHLMSHKSGKRVRRLRKAGSLDNAAEARRIRHATLTHESVNPKDAAARRAAALAAKKNQVPKTKKASNR